MIRFIAANGYFLMFAGTDTTSNALLRMAVLLNRYPDWFRRMQAEQDRLREEYGDTIDRRVCKPPPSFLPFPQRVFLVMLCSQCQNLWWRHRHAREQCVSGCSVQVLSRSPIAAAFAAEILRLKVPSPSAFRKATRDTVVSGIRVPKGTPVVVSLQKVSPPSRLQLLHGHTFTRGYPSPPVWGHWASSHMKTIPVFGAQCLNLCPHK